MAKHDRFSNGFRGARVASAVAALSLALLWLAPAAAQVSNGIIEAYVTDEGGGPLPGVGVKVTQAETGLTRQGVSGATGLVRFAALPPGTYELKSDISGFAPARRDKLVLRVGQTLRTDVVMRTSQTETVTVTAAPGLVDVHKLDSSTNVVPEQIQELPVPDRDFQKLAFIAPGVQRERGAFRFVSGGPVIGGGGNASQSTILVDGVDFTDPALGLAKTRFSQDAISEFRVINNRFDAEVGGSAGGALSIVTKSGTNELLGSVFGFYRADGLRAKGALEQDSTVSFAREQFGATVGGPIEKDRTHFFASAEQVIAKTPILFRPSGAYKDQAQDLPKSVHQILVAASLDQRFSDAMTGTVKLDWERYREDNFRVGGVGAPSAGQDLERDNYNLALGNVWNASSDLLNELRGQIGRRKYDEPPYSSGVGEWFSSGNTYQGGGSIYGDLLGDGTQWELRDTLYLHAAGKTGTHDVKAGLGVLRVNERFVFDVYGNGLFIYATDTRAIPIVYVYGTGSSEVKANTTRFSAYLQDDWKPVSNLSVSLGVRYDLDTNGNDPDFTHPLVPNGRSRDTNNVQPRLGFSWDVAKDGTWVARGGAGIFTGRYLLVPNFTELQQNGVTGWLIRQRLNGAIIGLPSLALDPAHPTTTGIPLPPDITLLDTTYDAPEATQASLGLTARVANTGLFVDVEGIWAKGRKEIVQRDMNWGGNANPVRLNKSYNQINTYTNDGKSEYKALTLSLNGNLKGGHLVTTSLTFASKKNISDDFSPELPYGYPNDPYNIGADYGRARSDEHFRLVMTGIFRLPWRFTVAPVFEYGSGQPWTRRYGYDYNADGKNSDRQPGDERFGQDGPPFRSFSLRITKGFSLGSSATLDLIAEGFNLFNTVNYDVTSLNGGQYLSGPTLTNTKPPFVANPAFGTYTATLPAREIQLGLRLAF